jgi:integrase
LTGANPIREASIPTAPEGEETYAYTLPEVMTMLRLLPDPARTIVAVAAFAGLRRSEIRGLEWQDYSGGEIRVMRSVWESVVNEPKTRKSKALFRVFCLFSASLMRINSLAETPQSVQSLLR